MAFTITRRSQREVTIVAGSNALTVSVSRATSGYSLETYATTYTITALDTNTITYSSDGIYVITVTESAVPTKYIDLCVEDVYDHLMLDIIDILNNVVIESEYSGKRYDFVSLTLLGLQFFGNTAYSLYVDATEWNTLPLALQKIEDAISRSIVYMELNGSTTQSSN